MTAPMDGPQATTPLPTPCVLRGVHQDSARVTDYVTVPAHGRLYTVAATYDPADPLGTVDVQVAPCCAPERTRGIVLQAIAVAFLAAQEEHGRAQRVAYGCWLALGAWVDYQEQRPWSEAA